MDIGHRIIELREVKGWSTNRLANLCGLSQSFLRSVELNEKGISVENLALLCETLGISLRDFFDVPQADAQLDQELCRQISALTTAQKQALEALLRSFQI